MPAGARSITGKRVRQPCQAGSANNSLHAVLKYALALEIQLTQVYFIGGIPFDTATVNSQSRLTSSMKKSAIRRASQLIKRSATGKGLTDGSKAGLRITEGYATFESWSKTNFSIGFVFPGPMRRDFR